MRQTAEMVLMKVWAEKAIPQSERIRRLSALSVYAKTQNTKVLLRRNRELQPVSTGSHITALWSTTHRLESDSLNLLLNVWSGNESQVQRHSLRKYSGLRTFSFTKCADTVDFSGRELHAFCVSASPPDIAPMVVVELAHAGVSGLGRGSVALRS